MRQGLLIALIAAAALAGCSTNGMVNTVGARAPVLADSRASDRQTSANSYYELITTDLTPELARIAVPMRVLYVRPVAAPMTDAQLDTNYRAAYRNARNATLTRVPHSAHFIMIDQPARFEEEVRAFLK